MKHIKLTATQNYAVTRVVCTGINYTISGNLRVTTSYQ